MKSKVLLSLLISFFVLVSFCGPERDGSSTNECGGDNACPFVVPDSGLTVNKFSPENWSLEMPDSDWVARESPIPEIKVVAVNSKKECTLLFIKEPTTDSYTEYVMSTIQALALDGAAIESINQVMINGTKFVLAHFTKDQTVVVWAWLSVKDDFGYVLACSCESSVDGGNTQHDLCVSVANSLQIN